MKHLYSHIRSLLLTLLLLLAGLSAAAITLTDITPTKYDFSKQATFSFDYTNTTGSFSTDAISSISQNDTSNGYLIFTGYNTAGQQAINQATLTEVDGENVFYIPNLGTGNSPVGYMRIGFVVPTDYQSSKIRYTVVYRVAYTAAQSGSDADNSLEFVCRATSNNILADNSVVAYSVFGTDEFVAKKWYYSTFDAEGAYYLDINLNRIVNQGGALYIKKVQMQQMTGDDAVINTGITSDWITIDDTNSITEVGVDAAAPISVAGKTVTFAEACDVYNVAGSQVAHAAAGTARTLNAGLYVARTAAGQGFKFIIR